MISSKLAAETNRCLSTYLGLVSRMYTHISVNVHDQNGKMQKV